MKIKLNLIPNYRREEIKKAKKLKITIREGFWLVFIFFFVFSGLFCFQYILKINLDLASNSIQSGNKKADYDKVKKMDQDFKEINELVSQIQKIQRNQLYWSDVLMKFNEFVPEDIVIDKVSTKNYGVTVFGISENREALLAFEEKLQNSGCFDSVSLPLSNLVTKENIDFQIDFNVKKECLKKQ